MIIDPNDTIKVRDTLTGEIKEVKLAELAVWLFQKPPMVPKTTEVVWGE